MTTPLKIAQISDSHLFNNNNALHCGANVYQNFKSVLTHILSIEKPDAIVFTGDLTQDHSDGSYQLFARTVQELNITIPFHYIAGNHDEFQQLNHYLAEPPFTLSKIITNDAWQVLLINSKSETPAGFITDDTLQWLDENINPAKSQLIMMHHHAIDVGYFIDKHGLKNKDTLWNALNKHSSLKALACGHVHNALTLDPKNTNYTLPLYTCPATSIQFDIAAETSQCNGQGAGYRIFELSPNSLATRTHFVS